MTMSNNLTPNYLDKPFIINQSIDINHKIFTPPSHSIEEYCNSVLACMQFWFGMLNLKFGIHLTDVSFLVTKSLGNN